MYLHPYKHVVRKRRRLLLMIIILLALGQSCLARAEPVVEETGSCLPMNDSAFRSRFERELTELFDEGKTTDMAALKQQLGRDRARIDLPERVTESMTFPELYRQCRGGVLAVGYLYKCTRCTKLHLNPSTGFVLTASGVIATAYHVVDNARAEAFGAMTLDKEVFAVKEVLAASSTDDIAILQLDGAGFQPLPLSPDAPVGTSVAMIGHPSRQFYMLTTGVISRYFTRYDGGVETLMMSATAEIGGGASGGPLLDTTGSVVGMASTTRPILADAHGEDGKNVQMVIKQYVPASAILDLVTSDEDSDQATPESAKQFINRMEALVRSGSWDALEDEAASWLVSHPSELPPLLLLARQFTTRPDQACQRAGERILRKVLDVDPDNRAGLQFLAGFLHSQTRSLEAMAYDRHMLELDPNNAMAMNNLAWTLSEHKAQYREALALTQKALKLAPGYADLLDTHGTVCLHLEQYDEAEVHFKKAIQAYQKDGAATPQSVVSRFHLAGVYWEKGCTEAVRQTYQECLDLQKTVGGLTEDQIHEAERRCRVSAVAPEGSDREDHP